jgi:hypothetical protein
MSMYPLERIRCSMHDQFGSLNQIKSLDAVLRHQLWSIYALEENNKKFSFIWGGCFGSHVHMLPLFECNILHILKC